MITVEYVENLGDETIEAIDAEFNTYAAQNGVTCDYAPFAFVAKENGAAMGTLTGHVYYDEVHVSDLIVYKPYRRRSIGRELMLAVENYYRDKGFAHMALSTYHFQAPGFYQKCGFQLEFVRENKENPKLSKYFFIKYL